MVNPDRLSGLDASFLHLEHGPAHMHVASCMIFEGPAPGYDEFLGHVESRLSLVPRYRQRLAEVPFGQGRPVWVDDPHFHVAYHVRHSALPAPGSDEELALLAGRVFSQQLDRAKPLWELWLVEGLADGRFAVLGKAHHALVDGISGVDITTVLFDLDREPAEPSAPPEPWLPRPLPSPAQLLADALLERATMPGEILRGVRATVRRPLHVLSAVVDRASALTSLAGATQVPDSPLNVKIGPHRRFAWVKDDLRRFKEIKNSLGGTVNDVVLAVVAGALGRYMRAHGNRTRGLELKAMVPVSVRADGERGALGNRVAAMWAPLPVGVDDPAALLARMCTAMGDLKSSSQAVGAQVLTELAGFAPGTILAQAARLQARQRLFNLVVTNVPGPQFPLYVLGRELQEIYPMVPLPANHALGIAIMSYNGRVGFGLNADWDALADLDVLATMLAETIDALHAAAGGGGRATRRRRVTPKAPGVRVGG